MIQLQSQPEAFLGTLDPFLDGNVDEAVYTAAQGQAEAAHLG